MAPDSLQASVPASLLELGLPLFQEGGEALFGVGMHSDCRLGGGLLLQGCGDARQGVWMRPLVSPFYIAEKGNGNVGFVGQVCLGQPPLQSFPCRTGHRSDVFVVNAVHGFGVRLPGGNAGEPFCVLGLGADFSPQLQHRLQREAGAAGHHLGIKPLGQQAPCRLQLVLVGSTFQPDGNAFLPTFLSPSG